MSLELIKLDDAAKKLSVSKRHLRRLIDGGQVAVVMVGARSPRIAVDEINGYIKSVTVRNTVPATA
jgi:excisionase family DNA binding protein